MSTTKTKTKAAAPPEDSDEPEAPVANKLHDRANAIVREVSGVCLERSEVAHGIMLALLSRQSAFFLGPPGVAKSMTVDQTLARITGAVGFDLLFTRFTEPGEVFGPIDIAALDKLNIQRRNPTGMLPEAHIAFLDEVFKANSAILNAMLKILNERSWKNGPTTIQVPLIAAIGASNETPQGEDLGALYDRFLMRYYVSPIGDDRNLVKMITAGRPGAPTSAITLADLKAAHTEVDQVDVTKDTIDGYMKLRNDLARSGIRPSDRRVKQTVSVVRSQAWLAGRDHTTVEDLEVCASAFWNDPVGERAKVRGIVLDVAAPGLKTILERLDQAVEQVEGIRNAKPDDERVRMDGMSKLRKIAAEVKALAKATSSKRVKDVNAKIQGMVTSTVKLVMGVGGDDDDKDEDGGE
jgi:MoxR-like ATPase